MIAQAAYLKEWTEKKLLHWLWYYLKTNLDIFHIIIQDSGLKIVYKIKPIMKGLIINLDLMKNDGSQPQTTDILGTRLLLNPFMVD